MEYIKLVLRETEYEDGDTIMEWIYVRMDLFLNRPPFTGTEFPSGIPYWETEQSKEEPIVPDPRIAQIGVGAFRCFRHHVSESPKCSECREMPMTGISSFEAGQLFERNLYGQTEAELRRSMNNIRTIGWTTCSEGHYFYRWDKSSKCGICGNGRSSSSIFPKSALVFLNSKYKSPFDHEEYGWLPDELEVKKKI